MISLAQVLMLPLTTLSSINGLHFESHDTRRAKHMLGMRTFMIGTKQPMKNFPDYNLHPQLDKDHTEAVVLFLAEAQKLATRALRSSLRWPILYFFFLS